MAARHVRRTGIDQRLDRQRRLTEKLARTDLAFEEKVAALKAAHVNKTAAMRAEVERGWVDLDARLQTPRPAPAAPAASRRTIFAGGGRPNARPPGEVVATVSPRWRPAPKQALVAMPQTVSAATRALLALTDVGGSATVDTIVARGAFTKDEAVSALKEAQRVSAAIWLSATSEYCLAYEGMPVSTVVGDSRTPREDHLALGGVLLTAVVRMKGIKLDAVAARLKADASIVVSKASLSQWRLGQNGPRRSAAAAMERVLGIPAGSWDRPVYDRTDVAPAVTGTLPFLRSVVGSAARASAATFPTEPDVLTLMRVLRAQPGSRAEVGDLLQKTGMGEVRLRDAAARATEYGLVRPSMGDAFEAVRVAR